MKKTFILMAALAVSTAFAAEVNVNRTGFGTGVPANSFANTGVENATVVNDGVLHAPQYLPGHPTSATIWPRVVEVPCVKASNGSLTCSEYRWSPSMGRAEYLFIKPVVREPVKPIIVPGPERIILKEVPVKKPNE